MAKKATLNVKQFGAKGDGVSNDTAAIQSAINSASRKGGGTVMISDGTYMITAVGGNNLWLKSNVVLQLSSKAVLQAIPNSSSEYCIIGLKDIANAKIMGGKLVGDRYTHTGSGGEWGHAIKILGSSNVVVNGVKITDCWGDGIYIAGTGRQNYSQNILVSNFDINNNRRQGISVISAKYLTIRDGVIANTNGTDPQDGIDLEPNNNSEVLQNILIENVKTIENAGYGIDFGISESYWDGGKPISVKILNCNDSGSKRGGMSGYTALIDSDCQITVKSGATPAVGAKNLIQNGGFDNTTGWQNSGCTIKCLSNIMTLSGDGSDRYLRAWQFINTTANAGDKIYVRCKAKCIDAACNTLAVCLKVPGEDGDILWARPAINPNSNQWYNLSDVLTIKQGGNIKALLLGSYLDTTEASGKSIQLKEFMVVNLTHLFGPGNEPHPGMCEEVFPAFIG